MTWKALKVRLSDPIVFGGLMLLVIGEIQAQWNVLLDFLSPAAAGRVLSLVGIVAMVIRYIQALPAPKASEGELRCLDFCRS